MKILEPLATSPAGTDIDVGALVDCGPPLRLKPGAIEGAIRRAHEVRAQAFRETIGALWRFGTRPALDAGLGRPCPTA
jgi:hypothetical protein